MKKFLIVIAASAILLNSVSAQILKKQSVQNTLYTGVGLPYEDDHDDGHGKFNWTGILDMLQVRLDWQWFTIDGGLSWGLPEWDWNGSGISFKNTATTQFNFMGENRTSYDYYVNFVVRPFKNFEAGVGTHLNWSVGPSPQTEGFPWMPLAHVLQGDFDKGAPNTGKVVGYFNYAYKWADPAIAARYTIGFDKTNKHYLQLGVAIPDGATSNHFKINAAAELKPIDLLTVAIAYKHADKENQSGNLYTGLKLDFTKNFNIDAWFGLDGIGLERSSDTAGAKMLGTGAAVFLKFGKLPFWIRPEFGFSNYLYSHYTMAFYTGGRINWDILDNMHLGTWLSFSWGARDKDWPDQYGSGFIFNIRPDFTFDINERHSISAVFEYEMKINPNDTKYDTFAFGFYWKYNRAF